jgi:hypothetical protein
MSGENDTVPATASEVAAALKDGDIDALVELAKTLQEKTAHSGEGDQSFRRMATTCSDRWRPEWREGAAG